MRAVTIGFGYGALIWATGWWGAAAMAVHIAIMLIATARWKR